MRVDRLEIDALKSFGRSEICFSPKINLITGVNNSGKSTLIRSLLLLQQSELGAADIRIGHSAATVRIVISNPFELTLGAAVAKAQQGIHIQDVQFETTFSSDGQRRTGWTYQRGNQRQGLGAIVFGRAQPDNFICPHLSSRKVVVYDENVDSNKANAITGNFTNLYAKVDRLAPPQHRFHSAYRDACRAVLGQEIFTVQSINGKRIGMDIDGFKSIDLPNMGDGIAHVLGLLSDLCMSDGKLFLIEEPENDLHPYALKRLLDEIVKKSDSNQFVISTHSNIVLRHLGAAPETRLFNVSMEVKDRIPTSTVTPIESTPEARTRLLESLGYELADSGIWEAWMFFEEASAERIFRDFLIPYFAPTLTNRVRTFSARTADEVASKFDAFRQLMTFIHLTPIYDEKAWVIVDGDEKGKALSAQLQGRFPAWPPDHFQTFSQPSFEHYYPKHFSDRVAATLSISDRRKRQQEKTKLFEEVNAWLQVQGREAAEAALRESAAEPIRILGQVAARLSRT